MANLPAEVIQNCSKIVERVLEHATAPGRPTTPSEFRAVEALLRGKYDPGCYDMLVLAAQDVIGAPHLCGVYLAIFEEGRFAPTGTDGKDGRAS